MRDINLLRCECKVISHKSSHRPVWCPACPPQSGTPWCGWGSCPWFLLPVKTSSRATSFSAACEYSQPWPPPPLSPSTPPFYQCRKWQSYLHGLVKPLCKVGRGVPNAFHCGTRRKKERKTQTRCLDQYLHNWLLKDIQFFHTALDLSTFTTARLCFYWTED